MQPKPDFCPWLWGYSLGDMLTEAQVLDALRKVIDPDFKKDIVTLGFVQDLAIEGDRVAFTLKLTTPACPLKDQLTREAEEALKAIGAREVAITQTAESPIQQKPLPGVDHVIAVVAGKGGVGKSTTAVNLAVALTQLGAKVGLFDADAFGPNAPRMLGALGRPLLTRGGKIIPIEAHGIKLVSLGLVVPDGQPIVWRGSLQHSFVRDFVTKTDWGELDYVVVDMPPGTGDIPLSVMQLVPLTGAIVVGTPQEVALEDVRRAVNMLEKLEVELLGFVENMSYFVCPSCGEKHDIFGSGGLAAYAEKVGKPLLGTIPIEPKIRKGGDVGFPAALEDGPLGEAYHELAENVARRVAVAASQQKPRETPHQKPFLNIPLKK